MKRIILLNTISVLSSVALMAQIDYSSQAIDPSASIQDPTVYANWNANKRNTLGKPTDRFVFDFSTDVLCPTATDAKTAMWWWETSGGRNADGNDADRYSLSYNSNEKALQVTCNIDPSSDNWGTFDLTWVSKVLHGGTSDIKSFNPFEEQGGKDSVVGPMLDLSQRSAQVAEVWYKIEENGFLGDSVDMRFDLGDANGRVSNFRTPHAGITKASSMEKDPTPNDASPESGYYVQKFNWGVEQTPMNPSSDGWNEKSYALADAWSGNFWESITNRFVASDENPYTIGGFGDEYSIDLDERFISKLSIGFNDGKKSSDNGTSGNFTVYIKKIIIGNQESETSFDVAKAIYSDDLFSLDIFEGNTTICRGTSAVYQWNKVANAEYYSLTYSGTGATISMNDTSATVLFSSDATPGTLKLVAKSTMYTSNILTKDITLKSAPAITSRVMGDSVICKNTLALFNIQTAQDTNTFAWTSSVNATINQDSYSSYASITFNDTASKAIVSVKISNSCGEKISTKSISVKAIPTLHGDIIGNDTLCVNSPKTLYAITPSPLADSYVWKMNTAAQPSTRDTISLMVGASDATISVQASNLCGISSVVSKTVVIRKAYPEPIGVVTFSDDGKSMIVAWEHTKGVGTKKYTLLRETTSMDVWEPVSVVPYEKPGLYVDNDVKIDQCRYRYKLVTHGVCGDSAESTPHRNLLLQTSYSVGDKKVNFTWVPYEGITVPTYTIFRVYNDGSKEDEEVRKYAGNETVGFDDKPVVNTRYRIGFKLLSEVDPNFYHLKSDGGPYSQSLSNLAESKLTDADEASIYGIKVKPNPASKHLSIEGDDICTSKIDVSNILGQTMNCPMQGNNTTVDVDVESLQKGIYFITITRGNKPIVVKFNKN